MLNLEFRQLCKMGSNVNLFFLPILWQLSVELKEKMFAVHPLININSIALMTVFWSQQLT